MPRRPGPRPSRSPTAASVPVAFDYALLRVVPSVPVGDGETVGVVLQARQARFLGVRFVCDPTTLAARWPGLDAGLLGRYLRAFEAVAAGGRPAAPLGLLPPSERFHWLTAPRSDVLQASPVHAGVCADPAAELDHLFRACADPPGTRA